MVEPMHRVEGYNTEAADVRALPLTHDGSEQTTHPVVPTQQHTPAEQPVAGDLDDRDVSLSGIAQYIRELRQMPRLSPEAEQQIVAQARQGDEAAKHQLIEARLPYIMHMANVYHVYAEHEDILDIVGVANLAVTTNIDKALTKENPVAYLSGIAKREIRTYCFYHSRLIPIKDHRMAPTEAPTAVPLDEQRMDLQRCYLGSLVQDGTSETSRARRRQLRQTVGQLPDAERQVVELRHGLRGGTHEFTDIAGLLAISRAVTYRRYYRALGRLRALATANGLASHFDYA